MRARHGVTLGGLFIASAFLVVLMGTYLWMALHGWQSVEIAANTFGEGYLELVMVSFATWTLGLLTANQLRRAALAEELPRGGDHSPQGRQRDREETGTQGTSGGPEADVDSLETPIVEET